MEMAVAPIPFWVLWQSKLGARLAWSRRRPIADALGGHGADFAEHLLLQRGSGFGSA